MSFENTEKTLHLTLLRRNDIAISSKKKFTVCIIWKLAVFFRNMAMENGNIEHSKYFRQIYSKTHQ